MKKLITALFLVSGFSLQGYSQISNAAPGDIAAFKKKNVYVVMQGEIQTMTNVKYSKVEGDEEVTADKKKKAPTATDETEYNKAIRFAMKNFWRYNKVEYITEEEFEEKRLQNNNFFITTLKYKTTDKNPQVLNILAVTKGGTKYKKPEKMPILAAIPLSYLNVPESEYVFKIPAFVQFLQDHMDYAFQNSPIDSKKMLKHYNDKSKEIKEGTLYACHDDLTKKVHDIDVIEKFYKGDVMIVEAGEIDKAIRNQDSHVTFAHIVSPRKTVESGICYKYIFSAKGGELLYISEHNVSKGGPEGLTDADFKAINK